MNFARRRSRKAVAGIVATVIMFAILFTVGTSYFIFVDAQNQAYVRTLLQASNNAQGRLTESLSVVPLLETNGDVGFTVNNTSSLTVNVTAILVISSDGVLLQCDGVGFPPSSGCSNTTPALWMTVNSGAGSPSIDTGYSYQAGTTVTLKVLTARGNAYSATYPSLTPQSSSSQSITVNLDHLRWVQLLPQSSSLVQRHYTSNCNAAACAAAYGSSVTAGNILVDGVGWSGQAPPASPPTDTLGDQFTLGAASQEAVPASTSVVQHKYTSNCNAATCGLAFSSSVGSGHTLVYAAGWANQNPPSAPTDTLGDSFTLGASNSETVVPPSPSLVQDRYDANCSSATCSLAFTSSVSAGNTLVYGLGWNGNAPYVPITVSNCGGCGTASLGFDGSTGGYTESTSASGSLTTTHSDDVIILSAGSSSGTVSTISDTAGLTWTQRITVSTSGVELEEWWAPAPAQLSSDSITVTWTSSGDNTFEAFAASGTNSANPFDTNAALPATATGTGTSPSVSVSTSNANDLVFGLLANEHVSYPVCHTETDGYGFTDTNATQCALGSSTSQNSDQEYKIVSSTQSNLAVSFTTSSNGSNAWAMVGDAVAKAAASSPTPSPFQQMVTWNPSAYSAYESSNLGNVRFCADSACGTTLYAWLESCSASCTPAASTATAWVKLTSSIPANGTLTIYMVFYATSTNFDGNHWGEAPELSSTYAQYDNGANVFNAYFNGDTSTSSFSTRSGYTLSQATGVTGPGGATINAIEVTGYSGNGPMFVFSASLSNSAMVVESSFSSPGSVSPGTDSGAAGLVNSAAVSSVSNGVSADMGYSGSYFGQDYVSGGTTTVDQNQQGTATSGWVKATVTYGGSGSSSWSAFIAPQFYSASGGYSGTVSSNPLNGASNVYLGTISSSSASYSVAVYYDYMRARAYPPNGAMPSVSFGSTVYGNGAPSTPSDTLGDTFTLGASTSVGVGLVNYYSYIWYATAKSGGADTISVTFGSVVNGTESIYELQGYTPIGAQSSTGTSSAGSTTLSVSSFTPAANSFVIGNAETSSSSTFTAGSGFSLVSTCASVYGCGEYQSGSSGATSVQTTIGSSSPWAESAVSFPEMTTTTYYSYVWYATANSGGGDTISATFSQAVAASVSIYEISGVTTTGVLSSTGNSTTSQSGASVATFIPASSSVVVGNTEGEATTYTAGSGYALSGTCGSVGGCGEYQTGSSGSTTTPFTMSPSTPWVDSAIAFPPVTTNYYSYIWYATAASSGADTVTTTFSSTVAGSVSIYEITGYTLTGALASTGNSTTPGTTASVASFKPGTDSFTLGVAEGASGSTTFSSTSGFTLVGTCNSVGGCSEYNAGGGGSTTTVPISLSSSIQWAEAAMSFSTPFNPQSGIQVNGYPTMGVPSGAQLVWEVTFTNVDPQHRAITIWPQTELAIGSAEFDGFDTDYTQAHYYIVDSLNQSTTTVNGYTSTTGQFITLQYGVPTTLYFAATNALGSTTQAFGTNVLTPFEAYFALTGVFSDGSLYGETVPYPYGIITEANAYTSPTVGATGATVTVACTSPCHFSASSKAAVMWINSQGQGTQVANFTMNSSGNVPSGVTFQVPSAAAGYYTIEVTDYTNSVFMTFQHT